MRKPQPSLTKGQVIAQKMAEANLIVDHQSAKTPVAALIDSELDKNASGSADNTDAVHSSSTGETSESCVAVNEEDLAWIARTTVEQIREEALKRGQISDDAVLPFIRSACIQIIRKTWKRALGSEVHASQAPTDSAVQQEEKEGDASWMSKKPTGHLSTDAPKVQSSGASASPQTSEAAERAAKRIVDIVGDNWHENILIEIIQSAIDAEDEGWLRKFEKIEQKFGPFDAAARVEPTKKEDLANATTPNAMGEQDAKRQAARLDFLLRAIADGSWRVKEDLQLPITYNIEAIIKAIDERINNAHSI